MTIEHRQAPRIQTSLPAYLITGDCIEILATVSDVSTTGLGIVGNRSLVENLLPNTERKEDCLPIKIDCWFEVPGQPQRIDVNCSVVYAQQSNHDRYKLGVQFIHFRNGCETALAQYLVDHKKY